MNRDERDDRPPALLPSIMQVRGVRTLLPTDAKAGGTWICVNEHGVALAMMNRTDQPGQAPASFERSRGTVIPTLAHHSSLADAAAAADSHEWRGLAPCRLRIIAPHSDGFELEVLSWSGVHLDRSRSVARSVCLASSGLGDPLVQHRLDRFERHVRPGLLAAAQDEFHRSHAPENRETSVLMSRPLHRTVSIVTVDVGATITMQYANVRRAGPASPELVVEPSSMSSFS